MQTSTVWPPEWSERQRMVVTFSKRPMGLLSSNTTRHGQWWGGLKTKVIGNNSSVVDPSSFMYCIGKAVTWHSLLHSQKIAVVILPFWPLIPVTRYPRPSEPPAHEVRKQKAIPSTVLCLMAWTHQQDQNSAPLELFMAPQPDTDFFFAPSPKCTA